MGIQQVVEPTTGKPAPPPADEDEGGGGGWALLTEAAGSVVAHLIAGRLADDSIESMLDTSNPSPGAWLQPFGDPLAPVKVYVRRFDLEKALLVLSEIETNPPQK